MNEKIYIPPYTVTDEMLSLVAEIVEQVGKLTSDTKIPIPHLRKENRIKTIQSSLAIENNSLTVEQVTAIVEGKRVLGPPNEIQEVKNAIDAYELLLELNPFKEKDLLRAHKLMMTDLVKENGRYRQGDVGVFDGQKCIHMAPPAQRVPLLMADLFGWVKQSKAHPLISSCVFHYEFEFIHPFADGNGRMGRMWQTLLLMQWKPIFAWIPVETIVKEHQQEYYAAIAKSDSEANSTAFITFMLKCLKEALNEMEESNQKSDQKSTLKGALKSALKGTRKNVVEIISNNPNVTIPQIAKQLGMNPRGIDKHLKALREQGIIGRVGPDKGGHWEVIETKEKGGE